MTAEGKRLFRSEVMARYAEELASIRARGETHPQVLSMAMNEARRWLDRELDLALPDPKPTESTGPILEEIDVLKLELEERDAMLDGILLALHRMDSPLYDTYVMHDGHSAEVVPSVQRHYQPIQKDLTWEMIESWWADHKVRQRARQEQEAQERERRRQEILSRLTAEERDILGIKE